MVYKERGWITIFISLKLLSFLGRYQIAEDSKRYYECRRWGDLFYQKLHNCRDELLYCPVCKICSQTPVSIPPTYVVSLWEYN